MKLNYSNFQLFSVKSYSNCWGIPLDIVFVLDDSNSIHISDFRKQLKFVNNFIDQMDIGMGATQVSIFFYTFFLDSMMKVCPRKDSKTYSNIWPFDKISVATHHINVDVSQGSVLSPTLF